MPAPHASAAEGHRSLLLTMAMDLSARRGTEIKLPLELEEFYRGWGSGWPTRFPGAR